MTKHPKIVTPEMMAVEAATILKKYNIDNIPVVGKDKKTSGYFRSRGFVLVEGIS